MSSAWTISFKPQALKQLKKLDRAASARIVATIRAKLEKFGHPRGFGEALTGEWAGHWRYRVGDYRVICDIQDHIVTILVVEVGHRRDVYR